MAGIDDVLQRLVSDQDFRARLASDARAALAGYELSVEDLARLAHQVGDDATGGSAVGRRGGTDGFRALFPESGPSDDYQRSDRSST